MPAALFFQDLTSIKQFNHQCRTGVNRLLYYQLDYFSPSILWLNPQEV
jgi:hypothetical protein